MVSALDRPRSGWSEFSPGGDTVLRSLARHLTLAVPLSTYGYNTSGTGKLLEKPNKLRGSDLLKIIMRILSRGGTNTLGRFML